MMLTTRSSYHSVEERNKKQAETRTTRRKHNSSVNASKSSEVVQQPQSSLLIFFLLSKSRNAKTQRELRNVHKKTHPSRRSMLSAYCYIGYSNTLASRAVPSLQPFALLVHSYTRTRTCTRKARSEYTLTLLQVKLLTHINYALLTLIVPQRQNTIALQRIRAVSSLSLLRFVSSSVAPLQTAPTTKTTSPKTQYQGTRNNNKVCTAQVMRVGCGVEVCVVYVFVVCVCICIFVCLL